MDRRAAVKAKHRRAILDAARELITDHGGPGFGVDELAARADVARRTVFNHFATLDEVLVAVCQEAILGVSEKFFADLAASPVRPDDPSAVFDDIASAARKMDLLAVISEVVEILGPPGTAGGRRGMLPQVALARLSGAAIDEIRRRHPQADSFETEILIEFLMTGLVVVGRRWYEATGGRRDEAGRAVWNDLVDRLLATMRRGYPARAGRGQLRASAANGVSRST